METLVTKTLAEGILESIKVGQVSSKLEENRQTVETSDRSNDENLPVTEQKNDKKTLSSSIFNKVEVEKKGDKVDGDNSNIKKEVEVTKETQKIPAKQVEEQSEEEEEPIKDVSVKITFAGEEDQYQQPTTSFLRNKKEHYSDRQCIQATLESILNLVESAPVTTSGSIQLVSHLESPQSPSPDVSTSSSPVPELLDLNNNSISCSNREEDILAYDCPKLVPLYPKGTTIFDSDCGSESNTTIEEEPLTADSNSIESPVTKEENKELAPDEETDEEEFEVESILKKKVNRRTKEVTYLVKWKGYELNECTWEPAINLNKCQESIDIFEKQEKKKKRTAKQLKVNENFRKKRKN